MNSCIHDDDYGYSYDYDYGYDHVHDYAYDQTTHCCMSSRGINSSRLIGCWQHQRRPDQNQIARKAPVTCCLYCNSSSFAPLFNDNYSRRRRRANERANEMQNLLRMQIFAAEPAADAHNQKPRADLFACRPANV